MPVGSLEFFSGRGFVWVAFFVCLFSLVRVGLKQGGCSAWVPSMQNSWDCCVGVSWGDTDVCWKCKGAAQGLCSGGQQLFSVVPALSEQTNSSLYKLLQPAAWWLCGVWAQVIYSIHSWWRVLQPVMCFSQEGRCSSGHEICWGTPGRATKPGAWHGHVQVLGPAGCSQESILQAALLSSS